MQTNLAKLKGTLHVESTPSQGCLFPMQLGLTVATVYVLIVVVQDISYAEQRCGLLVDALLDEQNVVIKPQMALLKGVRNVAGATILGTGEVCIVLHPEDLIKSLQRQPRLSSMSRPSVAIASKRTVLLVEGVTKSVSVSVVRRSPRGQRVRRMGAVFPESGAVARGQTVS